MIYADCESTLVKTNDEKKIHEHKVNSCCFYFVCTFDSSRNELFTYVGEDCLKEMTEKLFDIADKCITEMKENKDMVLTEEDKLDFINAKCCYLCNEKFDEQDDKNYKVRDHDHATGKYRGCAHRKCNIDFF